MVQSSSEVVQDAEVVQQGGEDVQWCRVAQRWCRGASFGGEVLMQRCWCRGAGAEVLMQRCWCWCRYYTGAEVVQQGGAKKVVQERRLEVAQSIDV